MRKWEILYFLIQIKYFFNSFFALFERNCIPTIKNMRKAILLHPFPFKWFRVVIFKVVFLSLYFLIRLIILLTSLRFKKNNKHNREFRFSCSIYIRVHYTASWDSHLFHNLSVQKLFQNLSALRHLCQSN